MLAQTVPGHRDFAARLVGVDLDVITHAVGGVQAHHAAGRQPTPFNQALEHALGIGVDAHGLGADDFVFQNRREGPSQVPGLKEGPPVNEFGKLGQVKVFKHPAPNKFRHRRCVSRPVNRRGVGACLGQWPHRCLLFIRVLATHLDVVGIQLVNVFAGVIGQQALRHAHAARCVGHIDHRAFVMRRNLHCGMHAAGGGAANQQRDFADTEVVILLHLGGHVLHFFQAGRDESGEAHNVSAFNLGTRQYLVARHHHAHVHDLEVIALQNHGHDVFANIVYVALDGGDDDLALGFNVTACGFQQQFFSLDIGQQMRHCLLHHAGTLDHLRQKHLALAEQITDDVHAVHQRAFNHVQRSPTISQNGLVHLFGVFGDELIHAMHQCM